MIVLGKPYPPFIIKDLNNISGLTIVYDSNIVARVMVATNCFSIN